MIRIRCYASAVVLAGIALIGCLASSGCSGDQSTTGTAVEKSPEAAAGEKASMEFMKANMMKGGATKK